MRFWFVMLSRGTEFGTDDITLSSWLSERLSSTSSASAGETDLSAVSPDVLPTVTLSDVDGSTLAPRDVDGMSLESSFADAVADALAEIALDIAILFS